MITQMYFFKINALFKMKSSIFEILIIPQTLNISNERTTSAKPINLDIIRKLIKYSLKNVLQTQCLLEKVKAFTLIMHV